MLRFNVYPPENVDDVDFSEHLVEGCYLEDLIGSESGYEERAQSLGHCVGSCLVANMSSPKLGTVLNLANGLCDRTPIFLKRDIKEPFLHGVVTSAINELALVEDKSDTELTLR